MNPATSNQYINKGCLCTYECICENIAPILNLKWHKRRFEDSINSIVGKPIIFQNLLATLYTAHICDKILKTKECQTN